jgi:XRE family transcriptional regulator, regulator of sulfur utilization
MNIGKAIKLILDKKGMTQKELAEKTKLSETSISLLLKGHTHPRKDTLQSIAEVLEVKPEFLLFLGLNKDDVLEEKKALYDDIWPQLEATFMKLFVKEK